MVNELTLLRKKITSFEKRYYINLLIRGAILTPAIALFYFVVVALLENTFWFGGSVRMLLFISFFLIVTYCLIYFFGKIFKWWIYKKGLNEEQSAIIIGNHFPSVGDRLLNVVQLSSLMKKNELLEASINQKSEEFKNINFKEAVDLSHNQKYLRYLLAIAAFFVILVFIDANLITNSTRRIVKFNQEFSPQPPFNFIIKNKSLVALHNEDFILQLSLTGEAVPSSAYLISGNIRLRLENIKAGEFKYVFEKLQHPVEFQIEASGFYSGLYKIALERRPEITQLNVRLTYPGYIGRVSEDITNAGNIEIPEGSVVTWNLTTKNALKAYFSLVSPSSAEQMKSVDDNFFQFSKKFNSSDQYDIVLESNTLKSQDKVSYSIDVIKDQYPMLTMESIKDTVSYKSLSFLGYLKDDYGISSLNLIYSRGENKNEVKINVPIEKNKPQQNFFYHWLLDSLQLVPGDKIYYFFEAWDNDEVNGHKATRSPQQEFSLPTNDQLKEDIVNHQNLVDNKIEISIQKAKDLKKSIDEAQQRLKGKQNLDWQDKKMLEDLISQKNKIDQIVDELKNENHLLEQKKEALPNDNEKIKEKANQIQKLMDELLDEETKKLFAELEKLLKENADLQQMQKLLENMDKREINLENELERTLQLFKELQYEYKLDQAINDIKNQIEKQEDISKETQDLIDQDKSRKKENSIDKENENSNLDLSHKQEQLKEDAEKFENSVNELKSLGEELKNEQDLPTKDEIEQLQKNEQNSKELLDQGKSKDAVETQKKSLSQMKQFKKQLQNGLSSMQMEIDAQNLESLRQIIHGLIKLSFDQEALMNNFSKLQQTDPMYLETSQDQIKLKNDSKVLEDSLLQISKKDPFISTVITREIGDLNTHVEKAVTNIRERRKGVAASEMQFSMSNINNLTLMLNDHFDMMMNMMASASAKGKSKGKGNNPESIAKLQEKLNGEIQKLKGNQKIGRQFSESMARMAAEQERIKRALEEMQNKMKKENGSNQPGSDLPAKMQQTELDLVNKQITEQTIRRQNEILTKLLEVEKSMREQKLDKDREAKTANDYTKIMPHNIDEYLKLKEREIELLKTLPPKFISYYKNEVNSYFKRIN